MDSSSIVDTQSLRDLFQYFSLYNEAPPIRRNQPASPHFPVIKPIQAKVNTLFEKDYDIALISNKGGDLCATYPLDLVIIQAEKTPAGFSKANNCAEELCALFQKGRFARVRTRFPVPVILFDNKNICRSATLSHKVECYLQMTYNGQSSAILQSWDSDEDSVHRNHSEMDRQRATDVALIKKLNVKYICDLMVENKKKKFGFEVCSSEKVDMHGRYSPFVIVPIPYPGIEFFREFHQNQHRADQLYFDWDHSSDIFPASYFNVPISFADYSSWDLISLTKNYFKLILHFVADTSADSGVLVHCISGWDRTPMMVSLLRISLWADGKIHKSLSPEEMLYLTVAYDWALFGHQLADRASRGEDIFYFCFYFLDYISSPDFAIDNIALKQKDAPISPAPSSIPTAVSAPAMSSSVSSAPSPSQAVQQQTCLPHLSASASLSSPSSSSPFKVPESPHLTVTSPAPASNTSFCSLTSTSFWSPSPTPSPLLARAASSASKAITTTNHTEKTISTFRENHKAAQSAPVAIGLSYGSSSAITTKKRRPSDPDATSIEIGSWQFMANSVSPPNNGALPPSNPQSSSSSSPISASPKSSYEGNTLSAGSNIGHRRRKSSDASDTTSDITCGSWQLMDVPDPSCAHLDKRERRADDVDCDGDPFKPSSWDREEVFPLCEMESLNIQHDYQPHYLPGPCESPLPTHHTTATTTTTTTKDGLHKRTPSSGNLLTPRAKKLYSLKQLFMAMYKDHCPSPKNSTVWGWFSKLT